MSLPELGVSASADATSLPFFSGPGEVKLELTGALVLGNERNLREVKFHLTNFHDYKGGRPITIAFGGYRQSWFGRLITEGEGWRVTVDSIKDISPLLEEARSVRGYVITHVGKLERIDNGTFTAAEANQILEALLFFFSFTRGYWVAPILPVGLDEAGRGIWQTWAPHVAHPCRYVDSWFPSDNPTSISTLFSGFLRRFSDPGWNEPIRFAIQWYVDSNLKRDLFNVMPGAIVIEQVALEMMSWVRLVEQGRSYSKNQFDKLPAAEKIRLLLLSLNVPISVPAVLENLVAVSDEKGWATGPQALTAIRNCITHSSLQKRDQFRELPDDAVYEAWKLGLWYIELVLLNLFDYRGVYHNRLRRNRDPGDCEALPWMSP